MVDISQNVEIRYLDRDLLIRIVGYTVEEVKEVEHRALEVLKIVDPVLDRKKPEKVKQIPTVKFTAGPASEMEDMKFKLWAVGLEQVKVHEKHHQFNVKLS